MKFKNQVRQAFYTDTIHNFLEWLECRRTIKITASDNAFNERYSR